MSDYRTHETAIQSAFSRSESRKPQNRVGRTPQFALIHRCRLPLPWVNAGNIGPLEIAIVLIIALIVFGPKRLPELGRSLGKGIREFKGSVTGEHDDDEEHASRPRSRPRPTPSGQKSEAEPVAHDRR